MSLDSNFKTVYTFERSELRALQNMCNDNEMFLNYIADNLGKLTQALSAAQTRAAIAEDTIRKYEYGEIT